MRRADDRAHEQATKIAQQQSQIIQLQGQVVCAAVIYSCAASTLTQEMLDKVRAANAELTSQGTNLTHEVGHPARRRNADHAWQLEALRRQRDGLQADVEALRTTNGRLERELLELGQWKEATTVRAEKLIQVCLRRWL